MTKTKEFFIWTIVLQVNGKLKYVNMDGTDKENVRQRFLDKMDAILKATQARYPDKKLKAENFTILDINKNDFYNGAKGK